MTWWLNTSVGVKRSGFYFCSKVSCMPFNHLHIPFTFWYPFLFPSTKWAIIIASYMLLLWDLIHVPLKVFQVLQKQIEIEIEPHLRLIIPWAVSWMNPRPKGMVFVNVILKMKNMFSFFCTSMPFPLPFFLFQQAAALLRCLLILWGSQLITDLGVEFVLHGDVHSLILQLFFPCLWAKSKQLCRKNRAYLYLI